MATNLKIDGDRLWQSLMAMAKIGATEKGGNCRLALTDLDKEGRARNIHVVNGLGPPQRGLVTGGPGLFTIRFSR